jgi:hypothetical protein
MMWRRRVTETPAAGGVTDAVFREPSSNTDTRMVAD